TRRTGLRQLRRVAKKVTGTRTRFWPDQQVFVRDARFSFTAITERARQTAYLVPGLAIYVRDERPPAQSDAPLVTPVEATPTATIDPTSPADPSSTTATLTLTDPATPAGPREAEFRFDGGISEFCEHLSSGEAVTDVLRLEGAGNFTETVPVLDDRGHMTPAEVERQLDVDVAVQWTSGYDTVTRSFVNVIATPHGGTHVSGFDRALLRTLNDQLRAARLLKNGDEAVTKEDVLEGMTAIVTVRLPEPQFEGQTKEVLGTPAVSRIVAQVISAGLKEFFEAKGRNAKQQSRSLLEKIISAAKARIAAREHRDNQRRKSALASSLLP